MDLQASKAPGARPLRKGQVAIYLIMSLVAIFLLALLGIDIFLSVRAKNNLQNGGDSAALAAAHRQGELINEIGLLNFAHIKAALAENSNECARIILEQRRLALIQPVYALQYASDAAKRNGMEENEGFAAILQRHLQDIRELYAGGNGDHDPYPESYPGAWTEYAVAIANVIANGLATGADNIEFYYGFGAHLLLDPAFYSAIASEDWCWFFFYNKATLDNYNSFHDWGPLPVRNANTTGNSEIFSLHLAARQVALTSVFTPDEIISLANRYGGTRLKPEDFMDGDGNPDCGLLDDPSQTWFFFDPAHWGPWFNGRRLATDDYDDDIDGDFPIAGDIKAEYNVRGCAAVCRTLESTQSFTTDSTSELSWTAAAKPFGTVDSFEGDVSPATALANFVVPCMTDTRLVSVDSVAGSNIGTADFAWVAHIRDHLPDYLANGPKNNGGCWYCAQLVRWERQEFRHRGANWLKYHSGECIRPVGGGSHSGGGTSRGH